MATISSCLFGVSIGAVLLSCDALEKAGESKESKDEKSAEADAKAVAPTADTAQAKAGPDGTNAVEAKEPEGPCLSDMALIDGGTFFIGTQKESPVLKFAKPSHKVRMKSFCIDKNETTVEDYTHCVSAGECEKPHDEVFYPQGKADAEAWIDERNKLADLCNYTKADKKDHPVNCVTWYQAASFCKFKGGRLPTEAEWEYAARGSDGRIYPWGDEPPSQLHANTCGKECVKWRTDRDLSEPTPMFDVADAFDGTAPVGSFPKGTTPQGINDLIGNVFEWTSTRRHTYQDAEEEDPQGPAEGDEFMIRGGAFNSYMADFTDPSLRFPQVDKAHVHAIGFRCASDVRGG